MPRFSVLTPVYETPPGVLRKMLRSVARQSFEDWEHCLVDDGSKEPHVREILDAAAAADPRVRVLHREKNAGIVSASNDALAMAEGEFVALLDHDDLLHPDALIEVSEAIDTCPAEADYIYTDEDKVDERGIHSAPFFKPDWSPERMRTQMYTCHMSVLRRSLVEEVGGFDAAFEGSQDWDLVLKVTERARRILHVPKILYHWRMIASSTAVAGGEAKPWAFQAGPRAVQAHCDRIGLPAEVTMDADPGILHLNPKLTSEPLVSLVIPTAGTLREVRFETVVLVENCVRSIVENSTYENYEIVIVADHMLPPAVAERLVELAGERLRIVPATPGEFNFSLMINDGVVAAHGEYVVLLNDDIDIATPDWIERMVMYCAQEGVGAVGGRLVWGDGRLQHVGVGFDSGLPGHTYRGFQGEYRGYANHVLIARDCLTVTAACMMTPKALFKELGGLTLELPVNFNDVDYCLKVFASGHRIVYDPDLFLYHYESSSREPTVNDWEVYKMEERWGALTAVDPYNNPNLRRGLPRIGGLFVWAKRRRPKLRQLR